MKCPYCEYKHGWDDGDSEDDDSVGVKGDFFWLDSYMIKYAIHDTYNSIVEKTLFACPSCGKTFIKV